MVNMSDMPEWNIEITEVLQKTVTYKAMTEQEAISAVKELYNREEIVLGEPCVTERKFERVNTDELERIQCAQREHVEETELTVLDYRNINKEIADDIQIVIENAAELDFFDNPVEVYEGKLSEVPELLLEGKVTNVSQISASSISKREGAWVLTIEKIPALEQSSNNIEQLIANRKKTHYGIYADIGTALENVSNRDLIEFYINKYGDQTLRDLCESMIIRGEINKEVSNVSQRQKQVDILYR